jgi:hypothetical protein
MLEVTEFIGCTTHSVRKDFGDQRNVCSACGKLALSPHQIGSAVKILRKCTHKPSGGILCALSAGVHNLLGTKQSQNSHENWDKQSSESSIALHCEKNIWRLAWKLEVLQQFSDYSALPSGPRASSRAGSAPPSRTQYLRASITVMQVQASVLRIDSAIRVERNF